MRKITLYVQDMDRMEWCKSFTADWLLPRYEALSYYTPAKFQDCPSEIFAQTNQPHRVGPVAEYHGPSMSVGDMCKVWDPESGRLEYFLCTESGWSMKTQANREIFEVLKLVN